MKKLNLLTEIGLTTTSEETFKNTETIRDELCRLSSEQGKIGYNLKVNGEIFERITKREMMLILESICNDNNKEVKNVT